MVDDEEDGLPSGVIPIELNDDLYQDEIEERINFLSEKISDMFIGERIESVVWTVMVLLEHLVRNGVVDMDWTMAAVEEISRRRSLDGSFGELELILPDGGEVN